MHYTLDYTETKVHELVRVDEYEKRINNHDKVKVMSDDNTPIEAKSASTQYSRVNYLGCTRENQSFTLN